MRSRAPALARAAVIRLGRADAWDNGERGVQGAGLRQAGGSRRFETAGISREERERPYGPGLRCGRNRSSRMHVRRATVVCERRRGARPGLLVPSFFHDLPFAICHLPFDMLRVRATLSYSIVVFLVPSNRASMCLPHLLGLIQTLTYLFQLPFCQLCG